MFNLKETKDSKFYYNPLYRDYIFNFSRVSSYYFYDYQRKDDCIKRAEDVSAFYSGSQRQRLAEILEKTNSDLGCSSEVINNIDKIRKDNTFVVIGGQQPGLFTGPIFIIYKILSVIKLSEYISDVLNINTVPVFWNASDDSNLSQINSFSVLSGYLKKIELEPIDPDTGLDGWRFSDILLQEELFEDKLEELSQSLQETDFRASIIDFLRGSIARTASIGPGNKKLINPPELFSSIISRMFSSYGLIMLDPSHPGMKRLLVDSVLFDLKNSGAVRRSVREAGDRLVKQGYHEQLNLDEGSADFFMVKNGSRHKILRNGKGHFIIGGDRYSEEDIIKMLDRDPGSISPNVILRPLFQDTILPVIATVCGPGEISYFAQLKGVYGLAGIKTAILYPRFSATIIENKVHKSMKKAGIRFEDLGSQKQQLINKKISEGSGAGLDEMLKEFEDDIFTGLQELRNRIISSGLDAGSSFDRIERNLKKESSVLKKKIYSELKNRSEVLGKNVDKIYLNVFPGDSLQERTISIFNYINKYDFCLLDSIYDNIDPVRSSHKFLVFSDS